MYGLLKPPQTEGADVIIAHEPPLGVLDATLRKTKAGVAKRAGSASLASGLGLGPAPALVICGHIHEGYGAAHLHSGDTLVVNACNANPGAAHSLVNLPTIIDLFL